MSGKKEKGKEFMGQDQQKQVKKEPRKRDERPQPTGNSENIPYRINGLEKARLEPGMSKQDIAALDRVINKLKLKLAEQKEPRKEEKEE